MNTYLVPVYNDFEESNKIEKYCASSMDECEDKIMTRYGDLYDIYIDDYLSFLRELWDTHGIFIGEIYDIDEL